jgi:arylsulfatase A-like enzyme
MMTGRLPTTTGVLCNRSWFRDQHPDIVSLPRYFRDCGYITAKAGKIFHAHLDDTEAWTEGGEARRPLALPAGLQEDDPARVSHSDRIVIIDDDTSTDVDHKRTDRALDFLRRYQEEPFFIACGFAKPHTPITAPRRFFDALDPANIRLPLDFSTRPTIPKGFPRSSIRSRNSDLFIDRESQPDEAREAIRAYLAAISYVDWNIGRLLGGLRQLGLAEKTIVVFCSDHGFQLGEKGKWSKAGSLFEGATRIPLIIKAAGSSPIRGASRRVVSGTDIYPTLLDLCGLPLLSGLEGASLVPLLNDPEAAWHRPAFSLWSDDGQTIQGAAVRTEGWTYAKYRDGGDLLIDTEHDPFELRNCAADARYADVVERHSKMLREALGGP